LIAALLLSMLFQGLAQGGGSGGGLGNTDSGGDCKAATTDTECEAAGCKWNDKKPDGRKCMGGTKPKPGDGSETGGDDDDDDDNSGGDCKAATTDTECEAAGCNWNDKKPDGKKCMGGRKPKPGDGSGDDDNSGGDCKAPTTKEECKAEGCKWNDKKPDGKKCTAGRKPKPGDGSGPDGDDDDDDDNSGSDCKAPTTKDECKAAGCRWNDKKPDGKKCMKGKKPKPGDGSGGDVTCDGANKRKCKLNKSCKWDEDTNSCGDPPACSTYDEAEDCENPRCFWSTGDTPSCMDMPICEEATVAGNCPVPCTWKNDKCIKEVTCSSITKKAKCKNTCKWDNQAKSCGDKPPMDCTSIDKEKKCKKDCEWEEGTGCKSKVRRLDVVV